jgi:hypothetical protein
MMWVTLAVVLCFLLCFAASHVDIVNPNRVYAIKYDTSIKLQLSTTRLQRSGDQVTVSWSGVQNPNVTDWIAAFSPGNVSGIPIRYIYANASQVRF